MRPYETIEYEAEDGAAIIRFDRPEQMNPISYTTRQELVDAWERADAAEEVRAAVITGKGEAFSAGYDFGEEGGATDAREGHAVEGYAMDFSPDADYLGTIMEVDVPVIAAVNGYAFAGACNLALYCDITIASEDAEFGYPEMHMGALPGSMIDPYVGVSIKDAKELYFTGKRVSAREAERLRMVNRAVPADDLMDEVWEVIAGIKLTPPTAVAIAKANLNEAMEKQGFALDGKVEHYLWAISMMTETGERFRDIVAEEGVTAAIEWMHEAEKTRR